MHTGQPKLNLKL